MSCKPYNVWCISICIAQWHFSISPQGEAIISWKPHRGSRTRVWANWPSTLVREPLGLRNMCLEGNVSHSANAQLEAPKQSTMEMWKLVALQESISQARFTLFLLLHCEMETLFPGKGAKFHQRHGGWKQVQLLNASVFVENSLFWKFGFGSKQKVEKKGGSAHRQHKLIRNYLETPFLTGSSERNWKGPCRFPQDPINCSDVFLIDVNMFCPWNILSYLLLLS